MLVGADNSALIQRLQAKDSSILTSTQGDKRQVRPLHAGIIVNMPDAVLQRTEDQFASALHYASGAIQIVPHLIAIKGIERGPEARAHIDKEYEDFKDLMRYGLDLLVVSGANITVEDLRQAAFFDPLSEIFDEAERSITSTFTACVSTHAYMLHRHGIKRQKLDDKLWGVFTHSPTDRNHPLTRNLGTHMDIIHARWNDISEDKFHQAGMNVLIKSPEAGVHMATSPDGLKTVCWQGHPEYEDISLMVEYNRDLRYWHEGILPAKPTIPKHYFKGEGAQLVQQFHDSAVRGQPYPEIPRQELAKHIENRWDPVKATLMANWISAVFDKTNFERNKQFMEGVNPEHVFNGQGKNQGPESAVQMALP